MKKFKFNRKKNAAKFHAPIIILSTGRSGSTLLQRIVNTSDNIVVWGEHNGLLKGISNSYFDIMESDPINKFHFDEKRNIPTSCITNSYTNYSKSINWLNSFEKDKTKELYRNFAFQILNQHNSLDLNKKWGFKEIRYTNQDNVVRFFKELYPETKFIFIIRDPMDVILSMMLSFFPESSRKKAFETQNFELFRKSISNFANRLHVTLTSFSQWHNDDQLNTHLIRYENLINSKEKTINQLFTFMNEDIPINVYKPLNVILGKTQNNPHHTEMNKHVSDYAQTIKEILGELPSEFKYHIE